VALAGADAARPGPPRTTGQFHIRLHRGETTMDVHEVMNHARDAMTVKRVFGDPYEKDGVTVIPVASIMGGAGAGGGTGVGARPEGASEEAGEAGATGAADSGYGMGYGLRATPAGVYVIKDGEVEWKPALDTSRVAMRRTGVIIVALLVFRSIVRTLAKR
jgi:uncharacterized spore protein YtfJ